MELSFYRRVQYGVDLDDPKDLKSLARHLGITSRRIEIMAEEDTLVDEHGEQIGEWIVANPHVVSVLEEEDIEDLEIAY